MMEDQPDPTAIIDARIGRNLRTRREALGMTQAELAVQLTEMGMQGFHQTTVARIEAGQRQLRASEAFVVARALNVEMELLAESAEDARLRYWAHWLQEKSSASRAALTELLRARIAVSANMDAAYPLDDQGKISREDIERTGASVEVYEIVERLLRRSEPADVARWLMEEERKSAEKYGFSPSADPESRVARVFDGWMVPDGEHQAEA